MPVQLSGSWNIAVTSSIAPGLDFGSPKRFLIESDGIGSGTYDGEPGSIGTTVFASGTSIKITAQNRNPFQNNGWVNSPFLVTFEPGVVVIGSNDDNSGDFPQFDDLVLTCTQVASWRQWPHQLERGTWVSWGVMVDAGGPTGNGPVPPWQGLVKEFAAGLALGEAARLVHTDLRAGVLELAGKQVNQAATAIVHAMSRGLGDQP